MKKLLFILSAILICGNAHSQSPKDGHHLRVGLLFNYGSPERKVVDFTSTARITYPVFKEKIRLGLEYNNLMTYGKYGNSTYAGGIAFVRINPYLGFTGELGYSYNKMHVARGSYITKGLFASIGYEVKLTNRWNIDFQYRALPATYLENNIIGSRKYLLGTSYLLKKR